MSNQCRIDVISMPIFGPLRTLRAQRLKKIKITLRDSNFQARLKISSEPTTKPLFSVGNSEGWD